MKSSMYTGREYRCVNAPEDSSIPADIAYTVTKYDDALVSKSVSRSWSDGSRVSEKKLFSLSSITVLRKTENESITTPSELRVKVNVGSVLDSVNCISTTSSSPGDEISSSGDDAVNVDRIL